MPKGRPKPGASGSGQGPGTPPDPNAPTLQPWADNRGEHGQLIVLLMEPTEGKLPNNPFILSRTIKEAVGSIDSAYRDQNKNLVIRVRSEKKAKKLQEVTELIDQTTKVKVTEHSKLNRSRCIVTCHSVSELTDKELEEELADQGVIGVHRFSKKGVKTNTMVVTVKGTVPPKEIAFGYEVCRTRPYKDSPMQCFRCFSFGHTKAKCASENETCRNCSEGHAIKKDEANKTLCDKPAKCKNCNGNHSPAARTCPRYLEEEKILEIRAKSDVSPREARRLYEEEKAAASSSYAKIVKESVQQQEADLKSKFQKQESQLRAEMKRELEAARKEIAQQFEKQIREMQNDHDVTKMALNLARQELYRLRSNQTEDDFNRKRKASESGSRSDDSDGSKDQASDASQNGERTEMLRHPDEIPFVPQTRPDGTTVQPMAHVFQDGHVIAYPSVPKDTEENINNDNTETNNNNNKNNNNNINNTNNNKSKNNKKKRRSNSKLPKTGERDGDDMEQNQEMEQ